jgi:predicted HicB family RNase H-like nuclease
MKKAPAKPASDDLVQVTVRLPKKLHSWLVDLRDNHGVSIQHAVKQAVEDYMKKRGA